MATRRSTSVLPALLATASLSVALGAPPAAAQVNGTTNRIIRFDSPTTGGDSQLFDNGFNVGIGTAAPQDLLHLYRGIRRSTVGVLMGNASTGPGRRGFLVDYHAIGGAELWNFENTGMWFGTNNARRLTITSNGRMLLESAIDANRFPGSGAFEIAGRLRLDGNEIITNTGATLFLNRDNGGDVRMDGSTFHLDASANRIGIGTPFPADTLHLRATTASTVGVLMGNGLVPSGRRGFLVDFHAAGGAELWNFENSDMWFGTNNRKRVTIANDGRVGIGGRPTAINYSGGITFRPLLDVQGDMRLQTVPVWDGSNAHDLTWSRGFSNGVDFNPDRRLISREGSSRRYKTEIQPDGEDFSKILAAEPRRYQMREGYGVQGVWNFGYIAEELHDAGLERLVIYDEKGRPDGVSYKKVAVYVNEVVKVQQQTIEKLQAEVAALQECVRRLAEIQATALAAGAEPVAGAR